MSLKFKKFRTLLELTAKCTAFQLRKQFSSSGDEGKVLVKRLVADYEGITVLGLNQPDTKNAFSLDMVHCFNSLLTDIESDNETRVLIVRSLVPKVFCVGVCDEKETELLNESRELLEKIEKLPLPVIAAIDGDALDYGLQLALACDLSIATCDAKFRPHSEASQRLSLLLRPAKAKELVFTAQEFTGQQAFDMGLVNYVVEQTDSKDAAYRKAKALAKKILPNETEQMCRAKLSINKKLYESAHPSHDEAVVGTSFESPQEEKSKYIGRWQRSALLIFVIILFIWFQALFILALIFESVLWNALFLQNWYEKGTTFWRKRFDDD